MEKIQATKIFTSNGMLNESDFKCSLCLDTGLVIATQDQVNDPRIKKLVDYKTVIENDQYIDKKILKVDCKCVVHRRMKNNLKKSGLEDVLKRYTFEAYETTTDYQKLLKEKAVSFAKQPSRMFAILGQSGIGKTHLCSAIAIELMRKGYSAHYMIWTREADKARANYRTFDDEYLTYLKQVKVLYIDDLLKTLGNGGKIEYYEFNALFSILNERKERNDLITIISTELSLNDLLNIDVALAGRIKEMSNDYLLDIGFKKDGNYRMKM